MVKHTKYGDNLLYMHMHMVTVIGHLIIELYNNNHLSIVNGLGKFRYTVNIFLPYSVLLYLKEH